MPMKLFISQPMWAAAKSVATTHQHYLAHCHLMHQLKGKPEAMAVTLRLRKDAHAAHHIALAFLRTATLKANPQLDLSRNKHINWKDRPALQQKLNAWADGELDGLIGSFMPTDALPVTTYAVIVGPADLRWA